jgi:hypothetical protein
MSASIKKERLFSVVDRKAIFAELNEFCVFSGPDDYMEVTKWGNREGFDVTISSKANERIFQFTYGEFSLLKKLVKALDKNG